jgi:hypothetical protein
LCKNGLQNFTFSLLSSYTASPGICVFIAEHRLLFLPVQAGALGATRAFSQRQHPKKKGDTFMKTIRKITLLAVCALATVAFAQQNPPAQGGGEDQGRRRGMPSVEDQVKGLTEKLSLTETSKPRSKLFWKINAARCRR